MNIMPTGVLKTIVLAPEGMIVTTCREMICRGGTVNLSIRQVSAFVKQEYILNVTFKDDKLMIDKFCFRSYPAQRTIDECYRDTPDDTDECTIVIDSKNLRKVTIINEKSFILEASIGIEFVVEFV